jgi:Zn-dependent protease with chaperone function
MKLRLPSCRIRMRPKARHVWLTIPLLAFVCLITSAQVSEDDANGIVAKYRSEPAAEQVAAWSRWSRVASDPAPTAFREATVANFPPSWAAHRSTDAVLIQALQSLFAPVLTLYHQDFTLFVVETPIPAIMVDSGSVLVISTGLVRRAESDDELLGLVAHEVAHAFFSQRSVAAKELYAILRARNAQDSPGAQAALQSLARIELECDAVAARTLSVLRLNPRAFIEAVERIMRDFPAETSQKTDLGANWHPPPRLRRKVIEALSDTDVLKRSLERSKLLQNIQGRLQ